MEVGPIATQSSGIPSRYESPSLIAEGGSGRVYQVRDTVRDLNLALKLVGRAEAAWLRREFETLRHIRHENLVQVYDWGALSSGDAYYTMELVEGGDWGQGNGSSQSPEEVRRILTGVLRGLAHLHSHGEIHGDLKPGNILLGTGSVVKVSDVGMGASDSVSGASATPGFAAPEMWEGGKASIQGDIYSAGVMAYEALTGHHPFEGRTVREVVTGQLEGWVPTPSAHGVALPADLERSVMRALERNPALRQSSADEFLEEIGVRDRIAEILGGRFVGRGRELSRLHDCLSAHSPETPTAVFICGPPGVGKTALIDEFAHQCLAGGQSVLHVAGGDITRGLASLLGAVDERPTASATEFPLSSIAEELWHLGSETPMLVRFEPATSEERATESLVELSRFLAALAVERGRAGHVLLILELHEAIEAPYGDSEVMILEPLNGNETALLAQGFLGALRLEAGQGERLHLATGGLPSAILDLIADLIARGVLTRRAGVWSLRDVEGLRELRYTGTPVRVARAWGQLDSRQRRVLTTIALFEQGIGSVSLGSIASGTPAVLQVLSSKGWTRIKGNRVVAASQGIRSAVLDLALPAESAELEELVLSDAAAEIDPEDRAVRLLRHPELTEALELGLTSAETSFASRDYSRAAERGQSCLRIALERRDQGSAKRALSLVADALYRLGKYDEAKGILTVDCPIPTPTGDPSFDAARERLLGVTYMEQGDLVKARDHLSRSIDLAERNGELSVWLRSQGDLADIEWRYGDEASRAQAIAKVREVIAKIPDTSDLGDERAALTYQFGSALILSSRREEATAVLQKALSYGAGDYWRMRIANAIAAAEYYLGHFEAALKWMDEARRFAESSGSDSYKARIHSNRAGLFYGVGRFRDAVEHHGLSAMWARRTGSLPEYQAACAGASVNLTITGRYEEAIHQARESQRAARLTGDIPELAKSYELEALATFHIGDYVEARRLISLGLGPAEASGVDVVPRLEWWTARLDGVAGDWISAEKHLRRALSQLEVSKDWEDLPGVQIELNLVAFRKADPGFDFASLVDTTADAERRGAVLVFLRGAVTVGEIFLELGGDDPQVRDMLVRALGQAEASGAAELSWQLSYFIGELEARRGDRKGASSRYGYGLRGFREIADRLLPHHRDSYLQTPHARALLSRVGGAS